MLYLTATIANQLAVSFMFQTSTSSHASFLQEHTNWQLATIPVIYILVDFSQKKNISSILIFNDTFKLDCELLSFLSFNKEGYI